MHCPVASISLPVTVRTIYKSLHFLPDSYRCKNIRKVRHSPA